jgi:hypothetical protein
MTQLAPPISVRRELAPSEIFERSCAEFSLLLRLKTVVLVEVVDGDTPGRLDGPARMMGWRRNGVQLALQQAAEDAAWVEFVTNWGPNPLDSGVPQGELPANEAEFITILPLPPPLFGILRCETARPLTSNDDDLLRHMISRLAAALQRARRLRV